MCVNVSQQDNMEVRNVGFSDAFPLSVAHLPLPFSTHPITSDVCVVASSTSLPQLLD